MSRLARTGRNSVITYDRDGNKLRAQYGAQAGLGPLTPLSGGDAGQESGCTAGPDDPAGHPSPDEMNRVDYCGNVVYDFGTTRLLTDEGYVTFIPSGRKIDRRSSSAVNFVLQDLRQYGV